MSTQAPLRVALIGTAPRALYMYAPVLRGLAGEVEVVAAWGRREESAARLGQALGVPWYLDAERLVRETAPDIGVVCVTYHANGEVGLMAVRGRAERAARDADRAQAGRSRCHHRAAAERGLKIEVAEQFHRRPLEQIKLKLIESGVFGRVHTSFSDFAGHGYHGVSVMRSYLGFDAVPIHVTGAVHTFDLAPHWSRLAQTRGPRAEVQEHGMIEFEDGRLGIFHWTDVGYDSALRWWRSSRFLAEKGMGITIGRGLEVQEWLSLLAPGGEAPRFITLERRWERVDGGRSKRWWRTRATRTSRSVVWDNPFRLPGVGTAHSGTTTRSAWPAV